MVNKELSDALSILIVDDEPEVLSSMLRLFHDEPYEIHTATGGQDGLKLLNEIEQVQLVISDFRMLDMSGSEFLRQVSIQWPDIRRVILSAYSESDVILAAINEGKIHHFIVKPWDDDKIKLIVCEMLDEYRTIVNFRQDAEKLARMNRLLCRTNGQLSAILSDTLSTMRAETAIEKNQIATSYQSCNTHPKLPALSPREHAVLEGIAKGMPLKLIASEFNLSVKTVSTYKRRLYEKMGFKNDAELIGYALSMQNKY